LQTIAGGEYYWSQTILERMRAAPTTGVPHPRLLTTCEQLVLSVIGGGADNATAARELGMSIGTVSSIRRDLHRKLGVQHRGELMRVAAQNGFVQFTPFGIVRPGYALLTAAHNARKAKRSLAPALAVA
jgi:DNA-binding NarL/FixJ family response regulator